MKIDETIAMISHIKEYIVDNQGDKEYGGALDMAIEALERTRWIPVSERLQDDLKECLLYLKLENGNQMAVGYFDIFIKKYFAMVHPYEALKEEIVTHWMPLPEPPEQEV